MKKLFFILTVMFLLVGCGNTDAPDHEKDTQKTESQDKSETQDMDTEANATEEDVTESESEAVQFTYADLDKTMYAATAVNVRDLPNIDGTKLGGLSLGQEVHVTGQCTQTQWYRIEYNGATGYVSNEYLADEKPSSWVKDLKAAQNTTQMIVVKGKDTYATVSMHTKNANGVWVENFDVKGRLGWGGLGKQVKGDGKTPIGVYTFTDAFGIKDDPGITALPYVKVDESHHWVGDPDSKYYNRFVSTNDVEVDWKSSEHLIDYNPSYNYSLALNYNDEFIAGRGSAIFLHCPNNTFGTTAGCIAIPEENMIQAMQLLRSDCVIIIDYEENIWNY